MTDARDCIENTSLTVNELTVIKKGGETVPEKYMDKMAKCPFYSYQDNKGRKIFCIGWLEGQHVSLNFSDNQDYKLFREGYCCSIKGCEQCPTYRMLRKEAEEDEYR